jgi:ABC-2 type transport system permease protein
MEFLLSAPVPARAVFVTKMLQAILPNFGFIALFSLPVLFGLGVSGGYFFLYYPLVVIILAMLALAAAGISSLLVMGVVRIFPARRVAEVLGFIGATLSILCSQSGNFMRFTNSDFENFSGQEVPLVQLIQRFNTPYSPLAWAGRCLVDIGEGRWLTGLLFLTATLVLTGGIFLIALSTAERLYYSGWASVQVGGRKKKPARTTDRVRKPTSAPSPVARLLPQSVRAVLGKDLLMMRRDLRNMSQLVTPIIVGLIYSVVILRTGFTDETPSDIPETFLPIVKNAAIYLNVGISMFLSMNLLSRLALMSFSMEGKNYWMIKISPVRIGKLILAKYLAAYLPGLAVGWFFLLVITLVQGGTLSVLAFGLIAVALTLAGTAGINLAFGISGANLVWEDPRRMNSGWYGCFSFLFGFCYVGITLVLFFAPPLILSGFGLPEILGQLVGILLGGGISLACAILPPVLVSGRVARIGEA